MKIVVKVEKAGQPVAQSEFDVKNPDKVELRLGKALNDFRDKNPGVSLFDNDVRIKFEKG